MDEAYLAGQLLEIERRVTGDNAGGAAARAELLRFRQRERDKEFEISIPSPVAQQVLLACCRRVGLEPYRKPGQPETTICVRMPRSYMKGVLWPQVQDMGVVLEEAAIAAVRRVIEQWQGEPLLPFEANWSEQPRDE